MTAKVVRSTASDVVATSQLESVAVVATFGPTALPADVQVATRHPAGTTSNARTRGMSDRLRGGLSVDGRGVVVS